MNKLIAARFLNASIPITKIEEWGGGGGGMDDGFSWLKIVPSDADEF